MGRTGPDGHWTHHTHPFLLTLVVIIPELVIPDQQVATVQVSPIAAFMVTLTPEDTGLGLQTFLLSPNV